MLAKYGILDDDTYQPNPFGTYPQVAPPEIYYFLTWKLGFHVTSYCVTCSDWSKIQPWIDSLNCI